MQLWSNYQMPFNLKDPITGLLLVQNLDGLIYLFFIYLVFALLRDCSLCWDHGNWEVVQTPHTNQALP